LLFNSAAFAVFFPVATIAYFSLDSRRRHVWLLLASAFFYGYFIPVYLGVLYALIVVDYVAGIMIGAAAGDRRRFYLAASLTANVLGLAVFKYLAFAASSFESAAALLGAPIELPALELALPIGLSFHTFQSMAYTIEVYRGNVPVERDFVRYALYVTFYPQLVAGPIERPQGLLRQLRSDPPQRYADAVAGLRLMAWGLLKKMVVADRLAVFVDAVYASPTRYQGPPLVVATLLFSIQIYCDFSGYSDIAIGAARVMGFRLMRNFDAPYAAASLPEFWRRWHVSLSTWFRDYVYVPLGGGRTRAARNALLTFGLSGLWHGASWTFVAWGLLHGLAWLISRRFATARRPLLGAALTFATVSLLWIFFRSATLSDAWWTVSHLASFGTGPESSVAAVVESLARPGFLKLHLASALAAFAFVFEVERRTRGSSLEEWFARLRPARRISLDYALVMAILILGEMHATDFIYFQF
jgi:D-alanyl-lipoteichoic acid acyltransferase DltB (MBOAT superfamily)